MDLHTPKQNPTNPDIMSPESDTDTETPLLQTRLAKALSLSATNGSLKPHRQMPHAAVSYKECLKNHAAKLGGLALDGCGEFMPSPTANLHDPSSLICAACGCHRNFHRRDPSSPATTHLVPLTWAFPSPSSGPSSDPASPTSPTTTTTTSPTPLDQHYTYPSSGGGHMFLGLTTGVGGPPHVVKRSRTKFTLEQKVKMQAFAEKLGWKMLRGTNDKMVQEFCSEVGVKRSVFKVWMHNNKHRKDKGTANTATLEVNNVNSSITEGGLDGYQVMERKVFGSSPTSP